MKSDKFLGNRGLSIKKNSTDINLKGFSGYELKHSKEIDDESHGLVQELKQVNTSEDTGIQFLFHQNLKTFL